VVNGPPYWRRFRLFLAWDSGHRHENGTERRYAGGDGSHPARRRSVSVKVCDNLVVILPGRTVESRIGKWGMEEGWAMSRVSGAVGLAVAVAMLSSSGDARADLVVRVDKSSQRMSVIVNGEHRYTWPVSTGIYGTPSGSFRPQSMVRYHRSTIYNNAPMPYSIFYDGNFAIHGTTHISQLGGRASRGCIRLHPSNAAVLFSLVQREGMASTRVVIQ
jgi:hypothetical protein